MVGTAAASKAYLGTTLVWQLAVVVSPSSVSTTRLRPGTISSLLTASWGSGSYSWAFVSGGTNMSLSSSSGTSINVSSTSTTGATTVYRSGTVRCSDAANSALYDDVFVEHTHEGNA